MRLLLIAWFGSWYFAYGQLPSINSPIIPTVDSVIYLSTTGSDANPGTYSAPKLTFQAALNALPFGTVGVNGNAAYGKIIFLAGNYYPSAGNYFSQSVAKWRMTWNGQYVYRNVSVEGEGVVNLYGDNCPNGHVLELRGNGISISNITLWNASVNGLWVHGDETNPHHDVSIAGVQVFQSQAFGIFVNGYERVSISASVVGNNCLSNENEDSCQWASGIRTDHCSHVSIRNSEAYNNWGEGVNPSLSEFVEIKDNKIYNNYSVNLYFHSTSNAVVCNNLLYSDDSTYWRYCFGAGGKPAGIDITNELSCTNACFFQTVPCGQSYACCAYNNDNGVLTAANYKLVDSIFIFNNVCINSKLTIYDSYSDAFNTNYLGKVFVENNDFIGTDGQDAPVKSSLQLYFPLPNVLVQPVLFKNNIFSYQSQQANSMALYYAHNATCDGSNIHSKFTFQNNLWKIKPNLPLLTFASDFENNNIVGYLPLSAIPTLTPSPSNPELVQSAPISGYITEDYYHNPRTGNSNVGAIEYGSFNAIQEAFLRTTLYPNPSENTLTLESTSNAPALITITSVDGVMLATMHTNGYKTVIDVSAIPSGIYFLTFALEGRVETHRFIKR
jgi:hypothetical protein